ncbi:MAG: FAD-binding oxidoreductase [Chloroflexi bacterium]|nr:FAD-binding oxidoreductase [Chloroflexota bacterium]|tara:strand:+ start:10995 stop:12449 length:1455 start_codon:yes stop_codon:yes gene_type:complete
MENNQLTALIFDLTKKIKRSKILDAPEDLLVYEYDTSIDRALPDIVILPTTVEEVSHAVTVAAQYDIPVIPRGSGTGFAGGALPVKGGILIVLTAMNKIREIDAENRLAIVEPGVINLHLHEALEPYNLIYAPDPSSQRICTIGGNVGTNSGGPHTLAYGSTVNHILGMEVVLPGGRIVWLGGRQLDTPGMDLRGVFVGSEGTLGIVTAICVSLIPVNETVRTMLAIFDSIDAASSAVSAVIRSGVIPMAMEMMDQETIKVVEPRVRAGYPIDAGAVLLIEVEGLSEVVEHNSAVVVKACNELGAREVRIAESSLERESLWEGRKSAIGALGQTAPAIYLLDGVVPRTKLPEILNKVLLASHKAGFKCANMFHAGDGNLHPTVLFDPLESGATDRVLELGGEIMKLCVDAGGSITGEHGIGLEKRSYMEWVFTESDLAAMEKIRFSFDPVGNFNPCKILPTGHGCAQGHMQITDQQFSIPGVYV